MQQCAQLTENAAQQRKKTLENNWRNGADDKAKPFTGTD
jgi:hypothetical protein